MLRRSIFFIYHSVWTIVLFGARLLYRQLSPKLKAYLDERQYPQLVWRRAPDPHRRRVWFHAASGEIEYIKPLLRLWRKNHPDDLIFISYFSTSARSMIAALPDIDGWAPLPFDLPKPCRAFLQNLNPQILIISRTDLWPTILDEAKTIPKILVASTWAEGSKKTRGLGQWMSQWCIGYLDKVCTVSQEDFEWLTTNIATVNSSEGRPAPSIVVAGDPRFDQVEFRLRQKRSLPDELLRWATGHQILIAGSTWEEDEKVLLPAWRQASSPQHRLLLVPHETTEHHLQLLTQLLSELSMTFVRWTEWQRTFRPSQSVLMEAQVLIFDQKGWLADLYALGDLAFIGGSFKKQVHSVMEALGCGLPVIVGPHYKNNREAIEFSKLSRNGVSLLTSVTDPADLAQTLKKHWQREPQQSKTLHDHIRAEFLARCGASEKTYKEIVSCL